MDGGPDLDVLVVGAGLSGLCAVHALRARCPDLRFGVVEARDRLGGTWDLFRYPGIRSDSDLFTLGFSFAPWTGARAIASGEEIRRYLEATARSLRLHEVVRYGRRVRAAAFDTATARWTVRLEDAATGAEETLTTGFLWVCAGYYRYDRGHEPSLPGRDDFRGPIVHPQRWPADLATAGRRVAVIGSGATAVTLVPALARDAAEVVMIQRTPTWVIALPSTDATAARLRAVLPARAANRAARWKSAAMATGFYRFCRRFPNASARLLRRRTARALGDAAPVAPHFAPPYPPWDQRLCVVPDGDLFAALRSGRARVVTDRIRRLVPDGVALEGGELVRADVIVTATGLELQFFGGARVEVDGVEVHLPSTRTYLGHMLSGVPNAAFVQGYTNASWTLKAELVCDRVARLLRHLRDGGWRTVVAPDDPSAGDRPAVDLSSGYFRRALDRLPRQGDRDPWVVHQDWFVDRRLYRRRPLADGVLRFTR